MKIEQVQHSPTMVRDGLARYRIGKGPPLLFMPYPHGLGALGDCGQKTLSLVHGLAQCNRTVLTFDPPGAGQSTRVPELGMPEMLHCSDETLECFDVDGPVDVVGHSQGGVAALAFTLEQTKRVQRLLLLNTSSGGPAFMHASGAIWNRTHPDFWRFALRASMTVLVPRRGPEIWMNNLIFRDSYVDRSLFSPEPVNWRDWLSPPRPRAGWGTRIARQLDYRTRLGEIGVPALVTAGRFDPQMPPECAEELARDIAESELVIFERSGHYPFVEEAEAFWSLVKRFLRDEPDRKNGRMGLDFWS